MKTHEYSTFTNAPPSPKIDLTELQKMSDECKARFLNVFTGIRVVVDSSLRGSTYYCAVSQEVYDILLRRTTNEV